ncbi:MAG TPA: TraR/DksA C4-type zinc finger protein [Longimicrobiales bacterium]|nr:TraR/DksA C4-type zinc finger protein [Longimicrobiales bacterium]
MSHLTTPELAGLRAELEGALARLERSMRVSNEAVKPVELDQAAVGRLSRMDSLQSQSMAKSLQEREQAKLALLHQALRRMDEGSYGRCTGCGGGIPFGRLLIFPETPTCQACGE